MPRLGGHRVPVRLAVVLAVTGALDVANIVPCSIVHWSSVSGFSDRPGSPVALLMLACYAPRPPPLPSCTGWRS